MGGTFSFVSFFLLPALSLFHPSSIYCLFQSSLMLEAFLNLLIILVYFCLRENLWKFCNHSCHLLCGEYFLEETRKCHYQPSILFLASYSPSALAGAPVTEPFSRVNWLASRGITNVQSLKRAASPTLIRQTDWIPLSAFHPPDWLTSLFPCCFHSCTLLLVYFEFFLLRCPPTWSVGLHPCPFAICLSTTSKTVCG